MSDVPQKIGPYEIQRLLGRGGMGEVYLAHDPRQNRDIALKVLSAESATRSSRVQRFQDEARLVASIQHPNIAAIHAFETDGEQALLALEYVPGESLAERLKHRRLNVDETLDLAEQLAAAVGAAHKAGLVHRDLKPGNVMITPDGVIKVLDFGLARDVSNSATKRVDTSQDSVVGTAGYAAPEQLRRKKVGQQVDLWAFGCVLYECLCGRKAFGGVDVRATVLATIQSDPDLGLLPDDTPDGLRQLIRGCLAKSTHDRINDFDEVIARLRHIRTLRRRAQRPRERSIAPVIAGGAALMLMLILIWALFGTWPSGSGDGLRIAGGAGGAGSGSSPASSPSVAPQSAPQPNGRNVQAASPQRSVTPSPDPTPVLAADEAEAHPTSDPNQNGFDASSLKTFSSDIEDPPRIAGGGGGSIFVDDGRGNEIVYVIDYSQSMEGGRLEAAKRHLIDDIERLDSDMRFYVIFFDVEQTSIPRTRLLKASRSNKRYATRWIQDLPVGGGSTDPTLAMNKAFQLEPDTIYLLSDGEFANPLVVGDIADRNIELGITINTIAFHSLEGRDDLEQVAVDSGGVFVFVPDMGIPPP